MMIKTIILATSILGLATPAMAQDAPVDAATEAKLNQNNVMTVRNVTRTELARGLQIFDAGGKPVGTVDHLSGNDVVLANGSREYTVPITEFFAYNQYGKDYFATRASKASLEAQASASDGKPLAVR
jgi:hypothetical protein